MASRRGTVAIRFTGDARDLQSTIGQVEGRLGGLGNSIGRLTKVVAGAFAGIGIAQLGRDIVTAGSNMEEAVSRANAVFGESAAEIRKWAAGAARDFGQSAQAALDAAGTFGNLFTQLGIGSKQAADMSQQLTELASDFASFHNADITHVIEAQTAAFRGEYDALQRYVPTINAAAVQQKALAMTGKENADALTEQEKAVATYTLMMEGAGQALGDFDRTSDSVANKQRILSAQWEDLKSRIGQALLPAMSALTGFFVDKLVPGIDSLIDKVKEIWPTVERVFGDVVEAVAPFVEQIVGFVRDLLPAFAAALAFLREQFASFAAFVQEIWPQVSEAVGHALAVIKDIISAWVAVVQELWTRFGDEILTKARLVWESIKLVVETVVALVRDIIKAGLAIINGEWGAAWDAIKSFVATTWNAIKETVRLAIEQLKNTISTALEAIKLAWNVAWAAVKGIVTTIWDEIKSIVAGAINTVVGFVGELPGRLLGFAGAMLDAGRALGASVLDGLKNGLTAAAGFAGEVAEGIVNVIRRAWNLVAGRINAAVPNSIGFGPFSIDLPDNPIPTFHTGGIVPGRPGEERLAILEAGERVIPRSQVQPGMDLELWREVGRIIGDEIARSHRRELRAI